MSDIQEDIHKELERMFDSKNNIRFTSTATEAAKADELEQLVLPEEERGRMPFTRSDFVIKEDPARVFWEREVRKFLGRLPKEKGHKVTGPMIYEWATGISLKDLMKEEGTEDHNGKGGGRWGSANRHLRHINWVLREYFGKPYKTTILGRQVGQAYTVRPWFEVKKKKPACLTLLPEWDEGVLKP
jgi:hypothetical protein